MWQVYVWSKRHQYVQLSFLGIFTFTAPYLPWVLLAFSTVLRSSPVVDILGMVAGTQSLHASPPPPPPPPPPGGLCGASPLFHQPLPIHD